MPSTPSIFLAGQDAKTLPYPGQCQWYSNWCWCAVASSLTRLYSGQTPRASPMTQAEVFGALVPEVPNAYYPQPGSCAQVGNLAVIDLTADMGFVLAALGMSSGPARNDAGFEDIRAAILLGRAPVLELSDGFGTSHVVAVAAYSVLGMSEVVTIEDPLRGVAALPVGALADYNGFGWSATYFTEPAR